MSTLGRRDFLKGSGAGLILSLAHLQWIVPSDALAADSTALKGLGYHAWEALYRQKWTWDKVQKSTHFVNCWYQASCVWNVYVKHGMAWREEQAAIYPHTDPEIPDLNPRGCQKGACYTDRMYDPTRIKYPLKRVGKRGEGKWQRITWEQALSEIAEEFVETLTTQGPGAIHWDFGTAGPVYGAQGLGFFRMAYLLDTPLLDSGADNGDEHEGAALTCGKINFCSSLDDMFHASMLLIWGGNPTYTQIPNAHYLTEARYHGTRIVTICPDYSPSAIHADLWVPVRIGTDAALALALSQVIVSENLHNVGFLKEQTDLPLLVRDDNRLFLRESHLKRDGGADDVFYVWDLTSKGVREMPKNTLKLEDIDPALEGEYEVETLKGKVKVRPVFELLKKRLEEYTPEKAGKICGTNPELIRRLAREIAKTRAVSTVTQTNLCKFYHKVELERGQILVLALCGHFGRRGAGHQAFPMMLADAIQEGFTYPSMPLPEGKKVHDRERSSRVKSLKDNGYTDEMIVYEEARRVWQDKFLLNTTLTFFLHGGLSGLMKDQQKWDPWMKRSIEEYVKLALDKGWQFADPGLPPKILIEEGGNLLRRIRGYPKLIEVLLPKLRLVVDVNWRLSNTGRYADYILPIAAWYERDEIRYSTPLVPYAHAGSRVVDPVGESLQEWTFHCRLARNIQERAVARGVARFKDRHGKERRLDNLYEELTYGGNYRDNDTAKLAADFVKVSDNLEGVTWDRLARRGFAPFTCLGSALTNIGNATDFKPNRPLTPNTLHVEKKMPWPTLTRRMQFYIDHELFFELGEELPVHKEEQIGGNYPLRMTGGHTRHSIHSAWRDQALMLQLQRGEPEIFMSVSDARARGITDYDLVRVYNDIGGFEIRAKVSPSCSPGQVIVYHAWEPYQFKNGYSHQTLVPSPINPVELAGGYFHLRPSFWLWTVGQDDRGTRVEVEKTKESGSRLGLRL